ncbi:MAG TPA: hypothetical protein O0X39_08385 [Methanocorpusculum sp.]|nr:hypothetical protein [Methanocorpusculum sp.]
MKKALITGTILLLITAAALLTAGCTTTTVPDPIEGTWVCEEPFIVDGFNGNAAAGCSLTFAADGTGKTMLIALGETETAQAGLTAEHTLTWKKTAENTYAIAIASFNGTVEKTLKLDKDTFTADTGVKFIRATGDASGSIFGPSAHGSAPDMQPAAGVVVAAGAVVQGAHR